MNKGNNVAGIVAGLTGGLVILLTFFLFHILLLLSLILGIASYIGVFMILISLRKKVELEFTAEGVTPEQLESTLKEGRDKIKILDSYTPKIKNPNVVNQVTHIIEIINRIFENFKKDPKDIKVARQFLSYYFDSTLKIVKMYVELSSQETRSPEMDKTLSKAEDMLHSIGLAYEKLLSKLLENDVMDLDVEIATLEKTFKAENLN